MAESSRAMMPGLSREPGPAASREARSRLAAARDESSDAFMAGTTACSSATLAIRLSAVARRRRCASCASRFATCCRQKKSAADTTSTAAATEPTSRTSRRLWAALAASRASCPACSSSMIRLSSSALRAGLAGWNAAGSLAGSATCARSDTRNCSSGPDAPSRSRSPSLRGCSSEIRVPLR